MIVTMKNIINQATTSALKAVPLAVMLAMSPLNKVQSENNTVKNADKDKTEVVATPQQQSMGTVVESKVYYDANREGVWHMVTYRDLDGNPNTIEKVTLSGEGEKLMFKDYDCTLVCDGYINFYEGDSDRHLQKAPAKWIVVRKEESGFAIVNDGLHKDLKTFVTSNRNNNAMKYIQSELGICWSLDKGTIKGKNDYRLVSYTPQHRGSLFLYKDVAGEHANFRIRLYSSDGNDDNYEYMTVQAYDKKTGERVSSELEVAEVSSQEFIIKPNHPTSATIKAGRLGVVVSRVGSDKSERYSIFDNNLAIAIDDLQGIEADNCELVGLNAESWMPMGLIDIDAERLNRMNEMNLKLINYEIKDKFVY